MLPRIAITTGDPAGVGPELCLQLAQNVAVLQTCVPILFGDVSVFRRVAERLQLPLPAVANVLRDDLGNVDVASLNQFDVPTILNFGLLSDDDVQPGVVSANTGNASFQYVDVAIQCAMQRSVDAIVTGPIHKEAFHAAGVPYPGHTEMLADRTSAARHLMMLTSDEITCSLVTAHVGLRDVAGLLSVEKIVDAIELSDTTMRRILSRRRTLNRDVRLTVCGLNPHAGEGGLFGNREEQEFIEPAIEIARRRGFNVTGPLPPDTAFLPSHRANTDCYVCMYHDQGLIPLKALAFDNAVNVTLGLPIIRTSVDHGTALDIAWQGKANVSSFVKAVELAVRLIA